MIQIRKRAEIGFFAPFCQLLGMFQSDYAAYYHPGPKYDPRITGRHPAHPGPIVTSQLLLEGDLGLETCQNRLSAPFWDPQEKRIH